MEWGIEWGGEGVRGGDALTRLDLIVNEAAARGIKVDSVIAAHAAWARRAAPGRHTSTAEGLRGFK